MEKEGLRVEEGEACGSCTAGTSSLAVRDGKKGSSSGQALQRTRGGSSSLLDPSRQLRGGYPPVTLVGDALEHRGLMVMLRSVEWNPGI